MTVETAVTRPRTHYSFVVDAPSSGAYPYQAYLLTRSLMDLAGVAASDISAFFVAGTPPSVEAVFSGLGVRTSTVQPFGHPYCNRIQQLGPLAEIDAERFILLDTDTFALGPLDIPAPRHLGGKVVDAPNPPPEILERIYARAGQKLECVPTDVVPGMTARGNFNGGLYAVPRHLLETLAEAWARWARWSLGNLGLYSDWTDNVDQVSFALAVAQKDLPLAMLPREFNAPTHLGPAAAVHRRPHLLHYHRRLDAQLLLQPAGEQVLDQAIELANAAIARWRLEDHPASSLFSAARRSLHPALESGPAEGTGHARDVSPATLDLAMTLAEEPAALRECVLASRRELGFFPDHLPRCVEYPWVLGTIRRLGTDAARVLDVGAGVSVLPVLLHDDGHRVTTVDSHAVQRTADTRPAWNEWGFLDYGELRAGIVSHNSPYESLDGLGPFDVIYSVSVVEHLAADVRREWLARMARQLEVGGRLMLSVDLEPDSRALWNRREGAVVESPAKHGTLDDLLEEIKDAGLSVEGTVVHASLPRAEVGLALITARLEVPTQTDSTGAVAAVTTAHVIDESRTVTVLVPAYRPGPRFAGLLESLARQTHDDVIVRVALDHAPDHEMPDLPDMRGKTLEIIARTERLGWVGNLNALLSTVTSPYHLLLMHDDQLTPTYLAECVAALERNPRASVAHGSVRHHGVRDGDRDAAPSIHGERNERLRALLGRGPHLTGLGWRGVTRSEVIRHGARLRTRRSDGQFSNDLYALELIVHGESESVPGVFYDKFTDPGGLSREFHRRTFAQKSEMLADNLACFVDVLAENGFDEPETVEFTAAYAGWLLGLQGNWNVVADGPMSDTASYAEVRPQIARFIANTVASLRATAAPAAAAPAAAAGPAAPPSMPAGRVPARTRARRTILRVALRLPHWFRRNPLFDARWYVRRYADVATSRVPAYRHFWRHGIAEGRDPNELFDTDWYLANNPDVRDSRMDPLDHYLLFGAAEGRDPGPGFSTRGYLARHPDVAASGVNPLLHYLRHGRGEGRALR